LTGQGGGAAEPEPDPGRERGAGLASGVQPNEPKPVPGGSCVDAHPELAQVRAALDSLRVQHLDVGRAILDADGGQLYRLDMLVLPVLQRSYGLVDALIDAVDVYNAHAAAPIVRLQLDSLFRMSYLSNAPETDRVMDDILDGVQFRKMTDPEGKKLTDGRLKDLAAERHPWAPAVYDSTSGWIHLSTTHVRIAFNADPEDAQGFNLAIPLDPAAVPVAFWQELLEGMAQATAELLDYCVGWASRKGLPPGQTRSVGLAGL
jgi:hypothetical protein